MKKLISLFLFFIFIGFSNAQEINTSKLLEQFHSQPEKRVEIATKLYNYYSSNERDSLLYFGNLTLQTGIETDDYSLMIKGKVFLAAYYNKTGKSELAKTYLTECISYYKRKNNWVLLSDVQNLMGVSYLYSNNHPKAIAYFIESLESSKKSSEGSYTFQSQINLADVYLRTGQLNSAESEALLFLERVKKLKLDAEIKRSYDLLGKIYLAKKDIELAYTYFQKALSVATKSNSKVNKAHSYNNIAIVYFENGDLDLAKSNFTKALELRQEANFPVGITESYYNLGDWHFYQDKFKEALPYYFKSLAVADSNSLLKEAADAYMKIAQTYEQLKDFKSASDYYVRYIESNAKIVRSQYSEQLEMQRIAYELKSKENSLKQSKRELMLQNSSDKQRDRAKIIVIIFSIISSLFLILYLFTVMKRNIHNNKLKKTLDVEPLISEKESMITNKWGAIEGFIDLDKKGKKRADSYLHDKVKFTCCMHVFETTSGKLIFWETNSSKLESYVFNNYIESRINEITDLESFTEELNKQELFDPTRLTYGIVSEKEDTILVCGNKGLLIQNENKMAFMTENKIDVKEYSVFVSENLKDYLIESQMWEKFLNQIDMTANMSSNMALTTIQDSWGDIFDEKQLGVFIVQPSI